MTNSYFTPASTSKHVLARASTPNSIETKTEAAFDKLPTEDNIKQGKVTYAVDTGAADAYVVALPHAPSAYGDGLEVNVKIGAGNDNTGPCTINVNELGAVSIKDYAGNDPSAGNLPGGAVIPLRHNGTNFRIVGVPDGPSAAAAIAAQAAQAAAETAQGLAETAQAGAETAETNAAALYGNLLAVEAAATAASNSAVDASSYSDLAHSWAEEPENIEVSVGQYSALHHAAKAAASAAAASLFGAASGYMLFAKADHESVAFTKTAAGTASIKAGTKVELNGTLHEFAVDTAVVMPALTAGSDYAIYVCHDATVRADANFSAPSGYTTANSRQIGGFHYALSNLNVNSTPNINEYSLWDLKWRPECADPRGMALVGGRFWADIYLLGVNHHTDGTSKNGATIADGTSPPKVALGFGGNGTTDYGSLTWYEAAEVMNDHGKTLLTYADFVAAAYGVTEASSVGTDQVTTKHNANYTSKWGIEQATGVMYVWGNEFGGPNSGAAWSASTEGRGSYYYQPCAAQLGGDWSSASHSGSRSANWNNAPSVSNGSIGARGRCDHLRLV